MKKRDDYIQNMVEHEQSYISNKQKDSKDEDGTKMKNTLTNAEILAQAVLFLFAGYDTTGSTLTLISYNLACNPEIQEKLIEEVDNCVEKHGCINYDTVFDNQYLDMVIEENMRMYPPATRIDRICNKDYEFEGLKIPKGQLVTIPIWALHHDPDIYPDPYKFNPDRFNEENKKKRPNEAYIPFGNGPRSCIGKNKITSLKEKSILIFLLN
jgi:cytochrome P450